MQNKGSLTDKFAKGVLDISSTSIIGVFKDFDLTVSTGCTH